MAKKFMFVCFGLLALMVTFHLGAQYGQAGYVDHSTTGIVAWMEFMSVGGPTVLLDNGEVWNFSGTQWVQHSSPPLPVSQIKFWTTNFVISTANELWFGEHNYGAPPGVVATQPSTWGSIKAQFKN
jgi:hypothetical protein